MNLDFCPNKTSKEFREMSDIFGEDKAYFLWMRNKGNPLDKAPNGAESMLFRSLLDYFKGNRTEAFKAKAKTYSNDFFNWFGNWTGTGTPKVKYYGATMGKTTASKHNTSLVDFDDIVREDIKKLAREQGKTVRLLKTESGPEYVALLKSAIEEWKSDISNSGKTLVVSNAALAKEPIFDNTPALPSKEEFVKRQVDRGEGNVATAEQYYDDLVNKWMPEGFITDNRFVSDIEVISKVVDENGEPLVVYHGTNKRFSIFKFGSGENTGYGTYTDPKTGEIIPVDSAYADFFSTSKGVAASYAFLANMNDGLHKYAITRALLDGIMFEYENGYDKEPTKAHFGIAQSLEELTGKSDVDALYDGLKLLLQYDKNVLKTILWIRNTLNAGKKISNNTKAVIKIRDLVVDLRNKLGEYYDNRLFGSISDWYNVIYEVLSFLRNYNNDLGIKRLSQGEIPYSLIQEWKEKPTLYINDARNKDRIFDAGEDRKNMFFDLLSHLWRFKDDEYGYHIGPLRAPLYDDMNLFFNPATGVGIKIDGNTFYLKGASSDEIKKLLDRAEDLLRLQLKEYLSREEVKRMSTNAEVYPVFLNIKTPLVHDYESTAKGGGYKDNKKIPFGYVAARLVRKARLNGNDGVVYLNVQDPYMADNYGVFNPNQIKHILNLGTWSTEDNNIYHHIDKKVAGTVNLLDAIPKEGATASLVVDNVVDFLKNKFVNLDISVYDDISDIPQQDEDEKRIFAILSSNKSIKSMVYRGKVYIIRSRLGKQGGQIASEEILHMLIKTLQEDNPTLFKNLLYEARETFKKLTKEIESTYGKFSLDTIENEIVTQALARFVNRDIQQNKHSKFAALVEKFVEWLKGIVRNAAERIGDVVYIDPTKLKSLTLQELSDLINAEDTHFDINIYNNDSFYNLEQDIESRRQDYINNVVSNWQTESKLEGEELSNAILKVKDNARKQFDLDEIASLRSNKELSDKDKYVALSLLYRDLEIVTGLQHTESIQKNLDKETFETIKEGTKTRLRSHLNRTTKQTKLINDLKDQLAQMENVNPEDIDEMFKQIERFLINAEQEILKTRRFIDEQLVDKDISTWDPQQINYIRYDLLGYYDGILSQLYKLFTNDSKVAELNKQRAQRALELSSLSDEEKQKLSREDQDAMYSQDLFELTTSLLRVVDSMQQDYQDKVAIPYAKKVLTDFVYESDAVKDKDTFIRNMIRWIEQDTVYGDLAVGEIALGMASRSRSSVINIVEKMMSDIEFEKNREILKEGNELIRLYNKVRPTGSQIDFRNFQKLFMEMDGEDGTSGKFTGYFVRDRNYGKFYKDKDAFESSLRDKYAKKGLKWNYNEYNDNYDLIFPEEDHTADNSIYNQYYDELDLWLDKHCERRYILEYYKKKRRFLSPVALQAQLLIQHQIDILSLKGMTEDGFIDSSKLTQNERQRLADLRKEKRELACPYTFNSLSDGTVTLKEKQGEDAEIARQITNWNRYIADHVKYKQNDEKFNAALSKFEKDTPEYKQFLADNRIQVINPAFWKYVLRNAPEQTKEYKELAERHRAIVDHIKRRRGFQQPNLDLLGTGINTDTSAWEELQRLEQQMEELRVRTEEKQDTEEYLSSFLVSSTKETDKQFLDWLGERWNYEMEADSSASEKFKQLFTYVDYKGRLRYLKVFSMTSPTSFNIKTDGGQTIPTTIYQYSSQFSELDESSDFVNTKYKKEIKFSMLPKVRKAGTKRISGKVDYTNDNYQKILENEGYKKLYAKLISIMEKANTMIPSKAIERRYLLPQITGRGMSILGRSRSSADLFASLNYGLQDWTGLKFGKDGKPEFDDSLMQQDTDVSTNWDLPRRPDGTIVNNIPVRFVKRLEDPSIISSDVLGSVLLYYDMALNYKLKSEKLPAFELILEAINPNTKSKQSDKNKLPKQYQKMKLLMDYRIYGKESKLGGDETKTYSKFLKSTMLISKKFRSLASMSMLALNFTTIEVGYLDALLGSIADAVGGKYFTTEDLRKGYWLAIKSMPNVIANLGNPVVNDWMIAAMLYNQLSKSNSEIFGRTDQSKWSRLLSECRMGGYTMADYLINTMILGATYNHYRLIDMPDGKSKRFMSKTDAIDIFTKHGYTQKEAVLKWESEKTTLRQAYYQEDGLLKIKDDFKTYINKKLENQIAGRLRDRTSVYNGIIPQTEKAAIQQNVFGSFLTLMRNFYVNTYWERARAGYDYANEEEIESNKFNMYTSDSAGSVNFETGEFGNGLWFSALKGLYKYVQNAKALITHKDLRQLTDDLKYAVNRILTEVAIIAACAFLMTWSIAFARTKDYDDDKDPMWTVNIFDPEGEDRGILEFNGKNAGDKMLNWTRWKLALLATRIFTERSTFYWPGTITELISSPSTAKSYLDDLGYSLELFMDLFEINGHDRNETVRSGGYKGMTRGTRDIMKITGATGIDNVIRNWHTSGIKSTLNWYQGISPNSFLIPNKSTWEKEQGIKSSSSGSKKRNIVY